MRLVVSLFTTVFVLNFSVTGLTNDSLELDDRLGSIFYDLWKDSAFGKDPNRTERAAWILRDRFGSYDFLRWPASLARNREFWKGRVPRNAVAQAHTHSVAADPRPAQQDIQICRKIALPLYTISGKGVWMVTPKGEIIRILDSQWYREIQKR